nr:hypothetical protein BdHM001_34950 [Bdellovibrio sp. HM001]
MRIEIQKKADLVSVLGEKLATALIKSFRGDSNLVKRLPRVVHIVNSKPSFAVNDNGSLTAYRANLNTLEIEDSHYCGSGDSTLNNLEAQLSVGGVPQRGNIVMFCETYWNGRNHSWTLTVVAHPEDVIQQITA